MKRSMSEYQRTRLGAIATMRDVPVSALHMTNTESVSMIEATLAACRSRS